MTVRGRAHAAHPVRVVPRVHPGAVLHDHLEPPEHRARRPGVHYLAVLHLDLDAKMPLDTCDGIDDDLGHLGLLLFDDAAVIVVSEAALGGADGEVGYDGPSCGGRQSDAHRVGPDPYATEPG